jgi:hypothetical protein
MSAQLYSALEIHSGRPWKSLGRSMAINDGQAAAVQVQQSQRTIGTPEEEGGLGWVRGTQQLLDKLLDKLLVPRDPRGIVLLCGFVATVALGVSALVVGDPIGYGYFAAVAIGYFFLQTRLVPTAIWLLIALGAAPGGIDGNTSDWIVCALGVLLAVVSLIPVPIQYSIGSREQHETSTKVEERLVSARSNGTSQRTSSLESSRKVEDSSTLNAAYGDGVVHLNGAGSGVGATELAGRASDVAASPPALVAIRTMGRLRLETTERDLTKRLNEQPRLEFVLSFLLARAVRGGDAAIDRTGLADEVAPGLPAASQRDRLRKQLYALHSTLGPQLKGLLRVNRPELTGLKPHDHRLIHGMRRHAQVHLLLVVKPTRAAA